MFFGASRQRAFGLVLFGVPTEWGSRVVSREPALIEVEFGVLRSFKIDHAFR